MILYLHTFATPVAPMTAAVDSAGCVSMLKFETAMEPAAVAARLAALGFRTEWRAAPCLPLVRQVEEYFAGARRRFELETNPVGTPFQRRVWRLLETIPYGQVRCYGELAAALGNPRASRGVGHANGRNPIDIAVPCHRVIGANGALRGYAGGLAIKRWLLDHERERVAAGWESGTK